MVRPGFCGDDRGAAADARVNGVVIRRYDFDLLDCIDAGGHNERRLVFVHSDIQGFRAIHLKTVVFGATAVDAEGDASSHADSGFVLSCLITDSGHKRSQLCEVAAVQAKRWHFCSRDGTGEFGGLRFYARDWVFFYVDLSLR